MTPDGRFVSFTSWIDDRAMYDVLVRDRRDGSTHAVNVALDGTAGTRASWGSSLSYSGRLVAFATESNLVPADTNDRDDVFVRDLQARTTRLVSVAAGGSLANGASLDPSISGDGRFVAFSSDASNLVPGDTNGRRDVFVRDLWTGTTRRVSVGERGRQADGGSDLPASGADGRYVAFISGASNLVHGDDNGVDDVFVYDLWRAETQRVSVGTHSEQGNAASAGGSMSGDGRFIAFTSAAGNLVPRDTNGQRDVFVRDLTAHTTQRLDLGPNHVQANESAWQASISASGRFVVYASYATNLVPGDTNGAMDIFRSDRWGGGTKRVSLRNNGAQFDATSWSAAVSRDGRFVAFTAGAFSRTAVFIRDLLRGVTSTIAT